jgi:hypothetical protein
MTVDLQSGTVMKKEAAQLIDEDSDFRLKFLDPGKVKFFRAGDALRITIEGDRSCLRVVPMRAFPVSMRDRYISLRDMEGNELGMIRDPDKLDKESRRLLAEEIRKRYFTPVIRGIRTLRDKFGIVEWEVETDRGAKKFLTRSLHDSLKETETGFIVTDIENNRYEIRDYSDLDPRSAAILARRV